MVSVDFCIAEWVPEDVLKETKLSLEFCCARKGSTETDGDFVLSKIQHGQQHGQHGVLSKTQHGQQHGQHGVLSKIQHGQQGHGIRAA